MKYIYVAVIEADSVFADVSTGTEVEIASEDRNKLCEFLTKKYGRPIGLTGKERWFQDQNARDVWVEIVCVPVL